MGKEIIAIMYGWDNIWYGYGDLVDMLMDDYEIKTTVKELRKVFKKMVEDGLVLLVYLFDEGGEGNKMAGRGYGLTDLGEKQAEDNDEVTP